MVMTAITITVPSRPNFLTVDGHPLYGMVRSPRKVLSIKVYPEDIDNLGKFDTSLVWDRFSQRTDVLTIHSLSDMPFVDFHFSKCWD